MEINGVGTQAPVIPTNLQDTTVGIENNSLVQDAAQLTEGAETAFAAVFFSLLQNVLSEAQNNSSS